MSIYFIEKITFCIGFMFHFKQYIPLISVALVFFIIAIRNFVRIKIKIWQVMATAAIIILGSGSITIEDAIKSIDFTVILFLFGMFIVAQCLYQSGYLETISYRLIGNPSNVKQLIFRFIMLSGILSALFLNDTIAIIGTPVALTLTTRYGIKPLPLLITLAFSITIGSLFSPIGNPQNLIVAIQGNIPNPFIKFLLYLGIPTLINLFICYFFIIIWFKKDLNKEIRGEKKELKSDPSLLIFSKIAVILINLLIFLKILLGIYFPTYNLPLHYIALIPALPILIFSNKRASIFKKIDWGTLIFFITMFIVMKAVWDIQFFQKIMEESNINVNSIMGIILSSITISQFISNVPFVLLLIPSIIQFGGTIIQLMALAAGSTIAGNLTLLGAASNIIIVQSAENHGETISFFQFLFPGAILTFLNSIIYVSWFVIIGSL